MTDSLPTLTPERRRKIAEFFAVDVVKEGHSLGMEAIAKVPSKWQHLFTNYPQRPVNEGEKPHYRSPATLPFSNSPPPTKTQWDLCLAKRPELGVTEDELKAFFAEAGVTADYQIRCMILDEHRSDLGFAPDDPAPHQMFMPFAQTQQVDEHVAKVLSEERGRAGGGNPPLYRPPGGKLYR